MAATGEEAGRSVYVIDGARTPFLKAKTGLGPFTGSDLAVHAGRALVVRQPFAQKRSLCAMGMPVRGAASPFAMRASAAIACARLFSRSTVMKAFTGAPTPSMQPSCSALRRWR